MGWYTCQSERWGIFIWFPVLTLLTLWHRYTDGHHLSCGHFPGQCLGKMTQPGQLKSVWSISTPEFFWEIGIVSRSCGLVAIRSTPLLIPPRAKRPLPYYWGLWNAVIWLLKNNWDKGQFDTLISDGLITLVSYCTVASAWNNKWCFFWCMWLI